MATKRKDLFASEEVTRLREQLRIGRKSGTKVDEAAANTVPKQGGAVNYLPNEGVIYFDPDQEKFQNGSLNDSFTVIVVAVKPDGSSYAFEFYLNSLVKTFLLCNKEGKYVDEEGNPSEAQVWITTKGTLVDAYRKCVSTKEIYELLCNLEKGVKITSDEFTALVRNFRTGVDSPKNVRRYTFDILK